MIPENLSQRLSHYDAVFMRETVVRGEPVRYDEITLHYRPEYRPAKGIRRFLGDEWQVHQPKPDRLRIDWHRTGSPATGYQWAPSAKTLEVLEHVRAALDTVGQVG